MRFPIGFRSDTHHFLKDLEKVFHIIISHILCDLIHLHIRGGDKLHGLFDSHTVQIIHEFFSGALFEKSA